MEFIVWVETRLAGKTLEVREVAKIERDASGIRPEELGLALADGKTVLKQVQERMVRTQVEVVSRRCESVHSLRSESVDKGLTVEAAADGVRRSGCILSPLRVVQLSRRQVSRRMASSGGLG